MLARFCHLHFREIRRVVEAFTPIFCTIPHSMYLPLNPLSPLKENNPHLYKSAPGQPKDIVAADGIP